MNLTVLHGDDIVGSRQRLEGFIDSAKKQGWSVQRIGEDRKLTFSEFLTSQSLFGETRLFILEDYMLLTKDEAKSLGGAITSGKLVIYSSKILPRSFLNLLPQDAKVEEFKLPRAIFAFLDALRPKNAKQALELLHFLIIKQPSELIMAMIGRHLRDLYIVKIKPESLSYPSWRISKLQKQAQSFSTGSLSELIASLAEIDLLSKTTSADPLSSLDLLIASKLE